MSRTLGLLACLTCFGCLDITGNTIEANDGPACSSDIVRVYRSLGDGAPCNKNDDCEHNICMPSINAFGSGICFSVEWVGCVAITEPVVIMPICSNPLKPYVCGNYDATLTGACSVVGTGDDGELYYCCETS